MTAPQLKLFAYQRDRLPLLEEDHDSFDSDLDVDLDIRKPKAITKFTDSLSRYHIETDLDRELLLGVLMRDCHLKQHRRYFLDQQRHSPPTNRRLGQN